MVDYHESIWKSELPDKIKRFINNNTIILRNDIRIEKPEHLTKYLNGLMKIIKDEERIKDNFKRFWSRVEDLDPQACFICGYYITLDERKDKSALKPNGFPDWVHERCYRFPNISLKTIHERPTEKSMLFCHFDDNSKLLTKSRLCRMKVQNTEKEIINHLVKAHGYTEIKDFPELWLSYRNQFFLKPNGKPHKI